MYIYNVYNVMYRMFTVDCKRYISKNFKTAQFTVSMKSPCPSDLFTIRKPRKKHEEKL